VLALVTVREMGPRKDKEKLSPVLYQLSYKARGVFLESPETFWAYFK